MTNKKRDENFNYAIGIDCGVNTGFAVWSVKEQKLVFVKTLPIHQALLEVYKTFKHEKEIIIIIEDARLRKWFGNNSDAKKQGAGSVKRDSKIWEDFCIDFKIPYRLVNPMNNKTKLDEKTFKHYTGFEGRTSNHARDASMLVFKLNK